MEHIYDSGFEYDFKTALAEAKDRAKKRSSIKDARLEAQTSAEDQYMVLFAAGQLFRETTYGYGRPTTVSRPTDLKVLGEPTRAQFDKHTERFGKEAVAEIKDLYERVRPIDVELPLEAFKTDEPQGRYTTPELVWQVQHLASRGFGLMTIADTLNLKDDRVRRIIRDSAGQ